MDWVVKRGMVRIPDGVSFEEATFVEPVNTVLKAVEKAALQPEQSALVVGQGQIGLLFTQILRARGVNVFASDPLAYRRDRALRFGAKDAFDPAADALPAEIKNRTGGRGADLAVVAVASSAVVAQAFEAVRPGGKVLLFAQTRLGDPLEVDAGAVCMLEKDLIGSYSADIDLQDASAELVFSRKINVRDLISHRFPLEEIESAIQMAVTPRENSLKIMVTI
jgi:L-iditol 2-dehydrogenase